jgi:hypothetical protein
MAGKIIIKGAALNPATCDGRLWHFTMSTDKGERSMFTQSQNVGTVAAQLRPGTPVEVEAVQHGLPSKGIFEALAIRAGTGALAGPGRLRTHGDARRGWEGLAADTYARRKGAG